jgi:hypothetical protein
MTSQSSERTPWREWASEQLGVSTEAADADAGIAFLGALESCDFTPPKELTAALTLRSASDQVGEQHGRALAIFRKSQAKALRDSVEQFAQRYWSFSPAVRQAEHARLVAAAQESPMARHRLEGLRGGLEMDAIDVGANDPVRALAREIQEIYVLAPGERAVRHHKLVDSLRSQSEESNPLALLDEKHPAIAKLEESPLLFNASLRRDYESLRQCRLFAFFQGETVFHGEDPEPEDSNRAGARTRLIIYGIFFGLTLLALSINGIAHVSSPQPATTLPTLPEPLKNVQLRMVKQPDGSWVLQSVDKDGKIWGESRPVQKSNPFQNQK